MSMTTTAPIHEVAAVKMSPRFWEIDAMRGVAIITMIVYHTMWDLWYWRVLPDVVLWEGFWKYWQRFTAGTFLILVGVSLALAYRRERARRTSGERIFPKFFWRGLKIFGLGMIITVVVTLARVGYVDFGILHLIGVSTILAYPFLRFTWPNLALWGALSAIGQWLVGKHFDGRWMPLAIGSTLSVFFIDGRWLAPLGITPTYYPAVDYFPLIPWFGVVLLGVWFGNWFYAGNQRLIPLPDWGDVLPIRGLRVLGRHSLVIYLVHQPLILLTLFVLGIVKL